MKWNLRVGFLAVAAASASTASAEFVPTRLAQQVTHSFNADLVPSPDGKRAVMISMVGGREQLFLLDLAQGVSMHMPQTQITRDDADHEDPVWSPDGTKIAFVLTSGQRRVVYVMNSDGSGREPVTPANVRAIHPSWSADGRRILYSTDDDLRPPAKNESSIFAVNIAGGQVATLITGGVNTFPVLSPDGSKIAWRKIIGDMNSEVFVAEADGSNPRNLTNHFAYEGWPAWSPDSRQIAFAGNRGGNYQIFVMKADGTDVRLVANTEGRATSPKWAPDGRTIYFTNCMKKDLGAGCEVMMARSQS